MCTRLLQKSVPSESCDLNFIVEQFYCFHSFSVLEVKQALRASDLGIPSKSIQKVTRRKRQLGALRFVAMGSYTIAGPQFPHLCNGNDDDRIHLQRRIQ